MQRSRPAARLVAYATLLVLVAGGTAAAQPGQDQGDRHGARVLPAQPLPLGPDDLPEERTTRRLEPGLAHTKIVRGHSSDEDRWTVTVGFASGEIPRIPLNLVLLKGVVIKGLEVRTFAEHAPAQAGRDESELMELLASGRISPHVSSTYSLDDVAVALRELADRRAVGKVLVTP